MMPYVQCEDGGLYYPAPEVLVVGVTSGLRGRGCDPDLGLRLDASVTMVVLLVPMFVVNGTLPPLL